MGQPGIMWYNYRQFEFRLLTYAVSVTVHLPRSEVVCNPRHGAKVNHYGVKDRTGRNGRGYEPRQSTAPERLPVSYGLGAFHARLVMEEERGF